MGRGRPTESEVATGHRKSEGADGKEGVQKIKELQEAFVFVKEDRGPHN